MIVRVILHQAGYSPVEAGNELSNYNFILHLRAHMHRWINIDFKTDVTCPTQNEWRCGKKLILDVSYYYYYYY